MSDCCFTQRVLNTHRNCYSVFVARETAAVSVQAPCTLYNHALVYSVILFEATYVGCMCIYHMHFWQTDHQSVALPLSYPHSPTFLGDIISILNFAQNSSSLAFLFNVADAKEVTALSFM